MVSKLFESSKSALITPLTSIADSIVFSHIPQTPATQKVLVMGALEGFCAERFSAMNRVSMMREMCFMGMINSEIVNSEIVKW